MVIELFMKSRLLVFIMILLPCVALRAQFTDSSTGLLQSPTALMKSEGTFMITNNFLNSHSLPTSGWRYNTFGYGFNITFWSRFEVGYVCTIFDGKRKPDPTDRDLIMFNQDRHFTGKFQLLKEGEFGLKWMPALAVGISDPTTASSENGYIDANVSGTGNGYFNRMYLALSKSFNTPWGYLGAHLGYQYNRRSDYHINAPFAGVNFRPKWVQDFYYLDYVDLIAEFDSRTFNIGMIASVWENRFELMFELQNLRWINFGARFLLKLKNT